MDWFPTIDLITVRQVRHIIYSYAPLILYFPSTRQWFNRTDASRILVAPLLGQEER